MGDQGTILRTTNGGNSCVPQPSGTTKTLYGVSFTDQNNGTVVGFEFGGTGIILRTTDGGNNWVEQTSYSLPQGASSFFAVSFSDANTGTIVGEAGIVLQTANGGQQWSSQPSVTFNYLHGVSFTDANTGSRSIWRDSQDSGSGSYAPANADTQATSHTCASTIMSAARKKISH